MYATDGGHDDHVRRPAEVDVAVPRLDLAAARQPAHAPDGHLAPDCIVCGDRHPRSLQVQPRPVVDARLLACEWVPPYWVAGEELAEHSSPGPATLVVLRGRAELRWEDRRGRARWPLGDDLRTSHALRADEDAVILLIVAREA